MGIKIRFSVDNVNYFSKTFHTIGSALHPVISSRGHWNMPAPNPPSSVTKHFQQSRMDCEGLDSHIVGFVKFIEVLRGFGAEEHAIVAAMSSFRYRLILKVLLPR